jgi:phospholipase A2
LQELLLAEKWARLHHLPFPEVKETVRSMYPNGTPVMECYVFKNDDPDVPVIIFFPLVNADFRHNVFPGVPRTTDEEKAFGDFSVYDDGETFQSCRFFYPDISFDRLTKMVAFNIENNLDVIKREMADIVKRNAAAARK